MRQPCFLFKNLDWESLNREKDDASELYRPQVTGVIYIHVKFV